MKTFKTNTGGICCTHFWVQKDKIIQKASASWISTISNRWCWWHNY